MTANIGCIGLIAIFIFIALLFARRRKNINDLQQFFKDHHFILREVAPVAKPFVYKDAKIGCSDGELKPGMPYTLILGSRIHGAGRSAVLDQFIGFYFPPQVKLSDAWLQAWRQKVAERGDAWAAESGVPGVKMRWTLMGAAIKLPIRALRVEDGGVLLAWIGLHLRKQIEERINDVLTTL